MKKDKRKRKSRYRNARERAEAYARGAQRRLELAEQREHDARHRKAVRDLYRRVARVLWKHESIDTHIYADFDDLTRDAQLHWIEYAKHVVREIAPYYRDMTNELLSVSREIEQMWDDEIQLRPYQSWWTALRKEETT